MLVKSLKGKFVVYITSLILFVSFSFLVFYIYQSISLVKGEISEVGFTLSRNLAYSSELAVSSEDGALLKPYLDGILAEEDVVMVVVYNKKGGIIASGKKIEVEERIPQEVMEELVREGKSLERAGYTQEGKEIYSFYSPVFRSGEVFAPFLPTGELIGFTRVGLSLEKKIATQIKRIILLGLGVTALLVLFGILISFFLSRKIVAPIKELIKGAKIIGKGNLGYRIAIKTGDEVEELAESFNEMARGLQRAQDTLEESKKILEVRVRARTRELRELAERREEIIEERTKELRERLEELEKFHQLTVGRELKMIELKKEIQKLKNKLNKFKKYES